HEWSHLMGKLRKRAPRLYRGLQKVGVPDPHPLFRIVPGGVRSWERARTEGLSNTRMKAKAGGRLGAESIVRSPATAHAERSAS
ncbi:MAG TPA: hypothetical protein VFT43_03425, partial [Candidatus Polarisedimenticolia bacterium]|nr:hypothetical protein [Candidatus Polarisedimenticolia bacterium]